MDEGGMVLKQMLCVMILFQLTGSWAYIYLGPEGWPLRSPYDILPCKRASPRLFRRDTSRPRSLTELKRVEAKVGSRASLPRECLPRIAGVRWYRAKYRKWIPS
jgi:hypothetical protein